MPQTDTITRLVSFTGRCLVHRAEIMQHHGPWSQAMEEATRKMSSYLLSQLVLNAVGTTSASVPTEK